MKIRLGRLATVALVLAWMLYIVFYTKSETETKWANKRQKYEDLIEDKPDSPKAKSLKEELDAHDAEMADLAKAREEARKEADALRAKLATMPEGEERNEAQQRLKALERQIPAWYDRFALNLGLDLRGGTEVRFRIVSTKQERKVDALEAELKAMEGQEGSDDYKQKQRDLDEARAQLSSNINDAVEVVRRRLNNQGLAEIPVTKEGKDRLRVQLPGMDSEQARAIISQIKRAGRLEFRICHTPETNKKLYEQVASLNLPPNTYDICLHPGHMRPLKADEIDAAGLCKVHGTRLHDWLEEPAKKGATGKADRGAQLYVVPQVQEDLILTGAHIKSARPYGDPSNPGYYALSVHFDLAGTQQFARLTENNVKRPLGIILDNKLQSAPVIREAIRGGQCEISGNFSFSDAQDLAVVLKSGSLPVDLEVEMENTVGPTLGEDSIRRGMQAIVIGLVIVLAFMTIYYLAAGVITDLGLAINMIIILAVLISARAVLTLPGIAGLILTVGMAVDANVLIFERIREELRKGLGLGKAIDNGYDRAFVTIVDANVTTLITAIILYHFGTEAVRGFAITLVIGIICSMFVSLFVTKAFFHFLLDTELLKTLHMLQAVRAPKIDFVRYCKPFGALSAIAIIAGLVVFGMRGEKNYAHDFTGGTLAHISLKESLNTAEARSQMQKLVDEGFEDVSLQSFGEGGTEYVLRTKFVSPESENEEGETVKTAAEFKAAIAKSFDLVADGVEKVELLDDRIEGRPEYEVVLNLVSPQSPARIEKLLADHSGLKDVRVRAAAAPRPQNQSSSAVATVAVSTASLNGKTDAASLKKTFVGALSGLAQDLVDPAKGVGAVTLSSAKADADGQTMLDVKLTLSRPATAGTVADMLRGSDGILSVDVKLEGLPPVAAAATEPASALAILCTVPLEDALGNTRTPLAQEQFVRSELASLRMAGELDYTEPFNRFNSVGPAVASEMQQDAIMALFYSMIAIFIYIWLRFQFRAEFGLGACLALVHDVLFTIGVIAIADELLPDANLQIDLTVVAALLTIVGYSLNDTIVVFDRIRENLHGGGANMREIINRSINQTLSRTLLTSLTTLLVVTALLVLGGEVIRGFAFSLLVGILVGTYSSIFIAAPVLVYMGKKNADAGTSQKAEAEKSAE